MFNEAKIRLHNTSTFADYIFKEDIDKTAYLSQIKRGRWSGPFKSSSGKYFRFISITEHGDNEYLAYL